MMVSQPTRNLPGLPNSVKSIWSFYDEDNNIFKDKKL